MGQFLKKRVEISSQIRKVRVRDLLESEMGMDSNFLFSLLNFSVVPAWAMLILLPRWSATRTLVHSGLYPIALGVFYTACLGLALTGAGSEGVDFTTIEGVRAIFSSDLGVLTGWAHYLVFDLFVGAWEARDAKRRGLSHWLLVPCLFFTFMAGPLGLLLYLALRQIGGKGGWSLQEG